MIYFDTKVSYWKLIVGMAVGIIIGVIVGSGLLVAYPIIIVGGIGALIIIYILIKSPTYESVFLDRSKKTLEAPGLKKTFGLRPARSLFSQLGN